MGITFTIKKKIIINWHPTGTTHLGSHSGFGLGNIWDCAFKSDGTRMYLVDDDNSNVFQYNLSTPWDITTETSAGSFNVGGTLNGVCLSSDGTKLFTSDNGTVKRFDLSTAWDVTTAGSLHSSLAFSAFSVRISTDGSTLFINDTGHIRQYALSTPFDLSTESHTGTWTAKTRGFTIGPDGLNLAKTRDESGNNEFVDIYDLATPWHVLSGRTYDGSVNISAFHVQPQGMAVSPDGTYMYVCESHTGRVDYYSLGSEAP